MINAKEIVVHGRVQRVMFRDYTVRMARKNNICGRVRNTSKGTVHIFAQSFPSNLEKFIELIHKGSLFSRVESVDVKQVEIDNGCEDFKMVV